MQFRKKLIVLKKEFSPLINKLARISILLGACYFLYHQMVTEEAHISIDFLGSASISWYLIALAILMTPINWGVEARKWQILVSHNSLYEALKSVLVGLLMRQFLSVFGDLSGRLFTNTSCSKSRVVGAFAVNSFFQMTISVLFGTLGTYLFLSEISSYFIGIEILIVISIGLVAIIVTYLTRSKLITYKKKYLKALMNFSKREVFHTLILSMARYLVFLLQFVLVFKAISPEVPVHLLVGGASFIFVSKTIIPTINMFGDLGIREFTAVLFFTQFGYSSIPIISASLMIWFINILVPAIVGGIFVPKLRMVKA